jgi:hypothetical protein
LLAQTASAIGFQLVAHNLAGQIHGSHDGMNVICARVDRPQLPTAMLAMATAFVLHNSPLVLRQEQDLVFQSFQSPFCQARLRQLIPFPAFSPTALVALEVRPVNRPSNEEGNRVIVQR